jgi:arylsulfatase A-like enzyme
VDFMPTILDLCGVRVPAERSFHGVSLKPLISGSAQPELAERFLVADTQRLARPVKWRRSSVMQGRWRLVSGCELYDLDADRTATMSPSRSNCPRAKPGSMQPSSTRRNGRSRRIMSI